MKTTPTGPEAGRWTIERIRPEDAGKIKKTRTITIHWSAVLDAPRVIPPIAQFSLGAELVFEVKGEAEAAIFLPEVLLPPDTPQPLQASPESPLRVRTGSDRAAMLPPGFMYAYTIAMTHRDPQAPPAFRAMEAVGGSPPGMVIDDPTSRRDGGD